MPIDVCLSAGMVPRGFALSDIKRFALWLNENRPISGGAPTESIFPPLNRLSPVPASSAAASAAGLEGREHDPFLSAAPAVADRDSDTSGTEVD